MYLMIDNYDSYVYNLVAYMKELNMDVSTIRDDKICWEKVKLDIEQGNVKGVIISSGPKHPKDFSYIHTLLQLTGAPKVRAMEIIDELEAQRRGIYTGIPDYLSLNGNCDFNIVICTALYQNEQY